MTASPFRCADAARDRGDPPLGSAPVTSAYLLVEHPGPWRVDALAGSGWSAGVIAALAAAVKQSRGRLLLIRRPGRRTAETQRAWAVSRVGGGTRWGSWRDERDLLPAANALRALGDHAADPDPSPAESPAESPAGSSAAAPDPLLLVCTHGIHDACCAIRGRPVAAALAAGWPAATWECTHVGGDRFAGNLIVLPDGTYYGALDAATAVQVVDRHLRGRVDPEHLRGSVRWPPPAQVAVGEIHRTYGPFAAEAVRAVSWPERPGRRWLVDVSIRNGPSYRVLVVAGPLPPAVLTCAATRATSAFSYRTESIVDL